MINGECRPHPRLPMSKDFEHFNFILQQAASETDEGAEGEFPKEELWPYSLPPCFTSVVCKVRDLHPWPGKTKISPDQAGGRASLMAQWGKNPPAVQDTQETWVWFLGWEDPLEKGMATRSSILAWRIPWTKETGRLEFKGSQRAGHDWVTTHTHIHTHTHTHTHIHRGR